MSLGLQKKTINKYINNRINFWVWSMNDPDIFRNMGLITSKDNDKLSEDDNAIISKFQKNIREDTIVTGGAIASMLLGEDVNDLDVYFKTPETAKSVAWYYLNQMFGAVESKHKSNIEVRNASDGGVTVYLASSGIKDNSEPEESINNFFSEYNKEFKPDTTPKHNVRFMSSNAITLANDIQIILRFTGEPVVIHENFDFLHATNYWTDRTGVVYNAEALQAILERRLYYIGSKFPVSTVFRFRKFIERGWRISAGEMMKVVWDVSKLDLTDINILKDQTIGMDSSYFAAAIELLEAGNKELDREYFFECIEKVFNEGINEESE